MIEFLIILVCIGCNALLAAAELAFVSMNKTQLRHLSSEGKGWAKRVLTLRENPEKTLSVIQLGITFVGIVAAAVGGVGSYEWLTPILEEKLHLSASLSAILAVLIFVIPFTFLSLLMM